MATELLDVQHFVCIVTRRTNGIFVSIPLSPVPAEFVPHYEHGVDVFYRKDWNEFIKVCWQFVPDDTLRGKVLREVRAKFYPTAIFVRHDKGE